MNTLYIIRGLPGSGKSTFAKQLVEAGIAQEHFEADMFMGEVFDYKRLPEVHQACLIHTGIALFEGKDVVVANVFSKKEHVDVYKRLAEQFEAVVSIIHMENNGTSVHDVPVKTLEKMRAQWEKL